MATTKKASVKTASKAKKPETKAKATIKKQSVNDSMIIKDKVFKGKAKAGEVRNPLGTNGVTSGLQPYAKRAAHYLEKYTASQLVKMGSDEKELDKLTSWDAIVVMNIAKSIMGMDTRQEREALLNRLEGKPKERIELRTIKSVSDLTDEELAAIVSEDGQQKSR